MDLSNTRTVAAPPAAVWEALNDPAVLAACLPGCESFERTDDGAFKVTMNARVGPVSARFNGRMTMSDVNPPTGYTLQFEGQGGAAGFAKGEARVSLAPSGAAETALTYVVKAQVGGKLAQIGSRLIDGAAAKMADDFFARFAAHLAAGAQGAAAATDATEAQSGGTAQSTAPTPSTTAGGKAWIRYASIIVIVIVLIFLYLHDKR